MPGHLTAAGETAEPKPGFKKTRVHVWYLEMTKPPERRNDGRYHPHPTRDRQGRGNYELRETTYPLPELHRFLYTAVGAEVLWYMRLTWTWQKWRDYLSRETVTTWVAYRSATPVGYFELERQRDGAETEIVYFGLLPEFIGKGFGKCLLADAIEKAWELASERIWLHTCSLDHESALPNYLRRGFTIVKEEDFEHTIPEDRLQPWRAAGKYPLGG